MSSDVHGTGPGLAQDRGQAAVLVVILATTLLVLLLAALSTLGARAIERVQAQTAADASALASLNGGRPHADDLARRHGGMLISWQRGPGPDEVTVVVRVGDATATARATDRP